VGYPVVHTLSAGPPVEEANRRGVDIDAADPSCWTHESPEWQRVHAEAAADIEDPAARLRPE
jgi:hypothetical protein